VIDTPVGSAELDQLAETLTTPCRLGEYTLEGLIRKTSTALIYVARGGAFGGDSEGVVKLTVQRYAPLLDRELGLLVRCQEADVSGVIRPVRPELEWLSPEPCPDHSVAAMLLPFLAGGDLVQLIGDQASRTGRLGPWLALRVGLHIGGILRALLHLPKPILHRDIKPQNVLLPRTGAMLKDLTLIDMDVSEELEVPLAEVATAPREIGERLVADVHGFGELLFDLATGREPPVDSDPNPHTGNDAFDVLVLRCLTSEVDGPGYVCMADNALWHDMETALATESARRRAANWRTGPLRYLVDRRSLAGIGTLLFIGLIVAVVSKVSVG
jgi:serine/threonine protein kinase